jgi:hypothetical protein
MSEIAYRRIGYAIIHSSSKERRVKCKMTENDRRGLRGRGGRLASASEKLLLKEGTASLRKRKTGAKEKKDNESRL